MALWTHLYFLGTLHSSLGHAILWIIRISYCFPSLDLLLLGVWLRKSLNLSCSWRPHLCPQGLLGAWLLGLQFRVTRVSFFLSYNILEPLDRLPKIDYRSLIGQGWVIWVCPFVQGHSPCSKGRSCSLHLPLQRGIQIPKTTRVTPFEIHWVGELRTRSFGINACWSLGMISPWFHYSERGPPNASIIETSL